MKYILHTGSNHWKKRNKQAAEEAKQLSNAGGKRLKLASSAGLSNSSAQELLSCSF